MLQNIEDDAAKESGKNPPAVESDDAHMKRPAAENEGLDQKRPPLKPKEIDHKTPAGESQVAPREGEGDDTCFADSPQDEGDTFRTPRPIEDRLLSFQPIGNALRRSPRVYDLTSLATWPGGGPHLPPEIPEETRRRLFRAEHDNGEDDMPRGSEA